MEITAAPWLVVSVAEEEQFSKEYHLIRLCGGLLGVSVRRNVAYRTLATALDFARCRHGKMFALSSVVSLHLFFKVLPLSPL